MNGVGEVKKTSKRTKLLLLSLLVVQVAFFLLFQSVNQGKQTWDSAGHINISMRLADEIKNYANHQGATLTSILKVSNYYPPFIHFLGAFSNILFGYHADTLLYITLFFFLLSIIYTYRLVFLLCKDERVALFSALFYSLFPQVVEQSRVFHLDIPLIALLLISIFHLIRSNEFTKTKHVLIFFTTFGLAQITKWYVWVFLLVPTLVVFVRAIRLRSNELGKIIKNIVAGLVIFIVISAPWYIVNFKEFISLAKIFSVGESDDPQNLLSLENISYYPLSLLIYNILLLPYITLILGFLFQLKKDLKTGLLYLSAALVPVIVFTFISNKNLRYILPLAPLFAFMMADLVSELSKRWKYAATVFVIYLSSGAMFLSFNQMASSTAMAKFASIVFTGPYYKIWLQDGTTFYSYDPDYWPIEEMLDYIVEDADKPTSVPLGISPLIDSEEFSAATLEMIRLEKGYKNVYLPVPYFQFEEFTSDDALMDFFITNSVEYVIAPDSPGPEGLRNYAALKQMVDFLASPRNKAFIEIKTYTMPNGLNIHIYKRLGLDNKSITSGECIDDAGFVDGIETIDLIPNHTYILFTGHFAIQDKIKMDYQEGVLYILQIENDIHESLLDIHNLPKVGTSMCCREGLGLDLTEEINVALNSKTACGENRPCDKVVHVKWKVGKDDYEIKEYKR